jgi:hypothetical protein
MKPALARKDIEAEADKVEVEADMVAAVDKAAAVGRAVEADKAEDGVSN